MNPTTAEVERCPSRLAENRTVPIDTVPNHRTGEEIEGDNPSSWGDCLGPKGEGICRILLQNPGGIGPQAKSLKMSALQDAVIAHDLDVLALAETNVNWSKCPTRDNLWSRTRGWTSHRRLRTDCNRRDPSAPKCLSGGTALLAFNQIAHRLVEHGGDPRGLGRWSWMRFKGSGNPSARIVCAYVPNFRSRNSHWSAYDQQVRGLTQDGLVGACPREQFWIDLESEIIKWQKLGDQLIFAGDWNQDVRAVTLFPEYDLHDVLLRRHGQDAPATHNRGSVPIDGIFCSPTLDIRRGGFLGFDDICGDHRGLWIDLPLHTIVGFRMPKVIIPKARRLRTEDPRVADKYRSSLESFYAKHDLYNRIARLHSSAVFPLSSSDAQEYERLDQLRQTGMFQAERQCRQLFHGAIPWSPEFATARARVKYWQIQLKRSQGRKINTRSLIRLERRLNIPDTLPSSREIKAALQIAKHRYREAKINGRKNRNNFLESLALAKAANDEDKAANHLRQLLDTEIDREASRRIKYVTGKLTNTSCSFVEVTEPDGSTREINSQRELESAILKENIRKYSQAHACPLLHGQLRHDIGLLGDGPEVDNILAGSYAAPPGTPLATQEFLHAMQAPPGLEFREPAYTLQDYRCSWKRARENTSSGALHYGHFKACADHPLLSWSNYLLVEIPFTSGYIPTRWQQATDVMLLKKEGNHALEKLRTIVLYEADFNMQNKVIGRQSMSTALHSHQIAPEQYSRPQRSAIDHALNRQLVFDHCAYRHIPYSLCSSDLQGCYDRIVHSAAILALRRVGVPASRLHTMFGAIQMAIHTVRTVFGDSSGTYSWSAGDFDLPPQGTGQGHGAGPQIWSVLSSIIFSILTDLGFSSEFINALTTEMFRLSGFAYVDDCDLVQLGPSITAVIAQTQAALSKWEDLIQVTGGSLAPVKCWWYLVDHKWSNSKWKTIDPDESHDLIAHDNTGTPQTIKRLGISDAQEMLGVSLAPDGDKSEQIRSMREKAMLWATQVKAGFLSSSDVWTSMTTGIFKGLQYPLPALTLTYDECRSILTPVIDAGLPRCGLTRKMPLAIRDGPLKAGGLGLPNLYLSMGVSRVQKLVEHLWRQTPTQNLLGCNFSNLLLEAGIAGNICDGSFSSLTYLHTHSWLRSTLDFMSEHEITLHYRIPTLRARRRNDTALMSAFLQYTDNKRDLYQLNICRMYLCCTHLSEIASADGRRIQDRFLGSPTKPPSPTSLVQRRYDWPPQPPPPKNWWNIWRKALKSCFLTNSNTLIEPLGSWYASDPADKWDWFLTEDQDKLWLQQPDGQWQQFQRTRLRSHRSLRFDAHGSRSNQAPSIDSLHRTTVKIQRNSIDAVAATAREIPMQTRELLDAKSRFVHFLKQEADSAWTTSTISMSASIDNLVEDFRTGTIISVSDGSYLPEEDVGAMEWIIQNKMGTEYIRGGGMIPGGPQSAYRSELGGIFGLTLAFYALWQSHRSSSTILIACDGLGALKKSLAYPATKLTTNCLHFDMISSIMRYWELMETRQYPVHVLGHQDDHSTELTRLEQMNVEMDAFAKARAKQHVQRNDSLPPGTFAKGFVGVKIRGRPITCTLAKTLLEECTIPALHRYWLNKCQLPPEEEASIDWTAFGSAFSSTPRHRQHFVIKWISGHGAFGSMMSKRKARHQNHCPLCRYPEETPFHCLTCPDPRAHGLFEEKLDAFKAWLQSKATCPAIRQGIITSLVAWKRRPSEFHHGDNNCYTNPGFYITSQTSIGWFPFLNGFISKHWITAQQDYFDRKYNGRSASRWASQLIRQLWNIAFSIWDHRNSILHKPEILPPMMGLTTLRRQALKELRRGRDQLPPLFAGYFRFNPWTLTSFSVHELIGWFKTVKLAREGTQSDIPDAFSVNGPLRNWIGLPDIPNDPSPDSSPDPTPDPIPTSPSQ